MQTIYMDNASTSFPKAPGVGEAMASYITGNGMNVFRGGYQAAHGAEGATLELREKLCSLMGGESPECAVITSGATYGLNMALRGAIRRGDHILVSSLEHNAVMRPLRETEGLDVEAMPCAPDGTLQARELERMLRPDTQLVACTYVSNVCGAVMPIAELGEICHTRGVPFVVDASQAVGHMPIDCKASHIDALVFSAHKGLMGPQGIGAAILTRSFADKLHPIVAGGTGSLSDSERQPRFMPDKLEPGTPNLPGIYGFLAALDYYMPLASELMSRERELNARLVDGLRNIERINVITPLEPERRAAVVSIDFIDKDNADMALKLEREHGILTRCGLHCAPAAHRALGTFPRGTVRLSPSSSTTMDEIDTVIAVVRAVAK